MPNTKIALVAEGGVPTGAVTKDALQPHDMYHLILLLCLTPDRHIIVSNIGTDEQPRFTATAAAIRLEQETPEQTAERAAAKLGIHTTALHHLGDQFFIAPTGQRTYLSVYYCQKNGRVYKNCALLTAQEITAALPDCTPALVIAWRSYGHLLPV